MAEYIVKESGYPGRLETEIVGKLVRCKDCKHYKITDKMAFGYPVKQCVWNGFEDVDDDDFCSFAVRKEGEA